MLAFGSPSFQVRLASVACCVAAVLAFVTEAPGLAQEERIRPVTDAELENPSPDDWLMWRRTLDGWGYSPLDQIDRDNVGDLRMVWSRGLHPGSQQGTPLVYDGTMYMPNPNDVLQAMDAVTGDLLWEYRRPIPDDVDEYIRGLVAVNRNVAIYGNLVIDTGNDDYAYAVDATTGRLAWETQILDYKTQPARHSSGPIIANGKVVSGRSCRPWAGPEACVITAHDATTGAELWRRRLIPAPGARRAGERDVGRRALRGARPRRIVDGAQLRPGAEPRLRRHVGDVPRAEVPAGRHREHAPLPQLDAGARRRHRRDRLVLGEDREYGNNNGRCRRFVISDIPRFGPRDDSSPEPSMTVQPGQPASLR